MKRCSISLALREIETEMTVRYHLEEVSCGEDKEKSEPLGITDGSVTGTATVETSLGFPQQATHRITV